MNPIKNAEVAKEIASKVAVDSCRGAKCSACSNARKILAENIASALSARDSEHARQVDALREAIKKPSVSIDHSFGCKGRCGCVIREILESFDQARQKQVEG